MSATDVLSPPPASWWSDRWAWRGAVAAAPFGALLLIVHALLVLRAPFDQALLAYGVGALLAAGLGFLLMGPLGGAIEASRRRRPPVDDLPDPADETGHEVDDVDELGRASADGAQQLTLEEAHVIELPVSTVRAHAA